MNAKRKPTILETGTFDGDLILQPHGWQIGLCLRGCDCHRPLAILVSDVSSSIGLIKHRGPCDCCEPWSYAELLGFLRDVKQIEELASTEEEPA